MPKKLTKKTAKQVETFTHDEASRKNIPTAEYQSVVVSAEMGGPGGYSGMGFGMTGRMSKGGLRDKAANPPYPTLTRRGLPPRKKRRAYLGAPTHELTGAAQALKKNADGSGVRSSD